MEMGAWWPIGLLVLAALLWLVIRRASSRSEAGSHGTHEIVGRRAAVGSENHGDVRSRAGAWLAGRHGNGAGTTSGNDHRIGHDPDVNLAEEREFDPHSSRH